MDVPLRKVTARVDFKAGTSFARTQSRSRPGSPTKQSPTSPLPSSFHPKAKLNGNATLRKLSSSSSLSISPSNHVPVPGHSRPSSPLRPSRVLPNASEPSSSPRARITARPISRSGTSPVQTSLSNLEPRQRALTAASAKLKLSHSEERTRSGSVITLHHDHALSITDLNRSSPQSPPQPSPFVDIGQTNATPLLAPIRIKSKVTGYIKSTPTNTGDSASPPLSPACATTRPINSRSRAPSITSFSTIDTPPSAFYPITTASPAANPHRYAPRRAQSPARPYTSPTLSSEPHPARQSSLVAKVDPASVPLPPHSPPISALSLSSKSSVSKTSVSLSSDHTTDNPLSSVVSHTKRCSIERPGQPNPFLSQAENRAQMKQDRSRSKERNHHDLIHRSESDTESAGSERQLKAEAKTNRKIADLEITNRSLLAINASLETTKNRQAKEIRDLRRKLRESRLILPPQTFKAVTSALEDDDEDDDDSDAEERPDETFQRVKNLIDSLIESGKKALETRPEDFRASLATKVLNADELRSWRDSGQRVSTRISFMDKHNADDETMHGHLTPVIVAMLPDSGATSPVESEGELVPTGGSSALPPITITHSL